MTMDPGQRITYIKECAKILSKETNEEIDLVLRQHDLPTSNLETSDTAYIYVINMIDRADEAKLRQLHSYLVGSNISSSPDVGQSDDEINIFFSHLTLHREFVGQVSSRLKNFGITAFVAHNDISPSQLWQDVIEANLSQCDAMVVFLHENFKNSDWCDQEVGWVMSRRQPILPLWFDAPPHGFLAKSQAKKMTGASSTEVATIILDWLLAQPALQTKLSRGFSEAFAKSPNYNSTREIASLLRRVQIFDEASIDLLIKAAAQNRQIKDATIPGFIEGTFLLGPEWVHEFVTQHRSSIQ